MHARSRHGGFHGDTAVPEPHRILDRAFRAHPPGSGTPEISGPGAASAFPGSFVAGRDRLTRRLGTVSTQAEHPFSLYRGHGRCWAPARSNSVEQGPVEFLDGHPLG